MGQQPDDRLRAHRARSQRRRGPAPEASPPSPARRPVTLFAAQLQRWRALFREPLYDVQVVWATAVEGTEGFQTRLVPGDGPAGTVRIEVDAGLTDDEAQYAVLLALAQVHVAELRAQSEQLSAHLSAQAGPHRAADAGARSP